MTNKMRVAVIDDHPLYRSGVVYTLESQPDIEVIAQGTSASDALHVASALSPDVLILDVNVPGGGPSCLTQLTTHCPMVKVLILGKTGEGAEVCDALRNGASGYILKGTSPDELVQAVRGLGRGEGYVSPALAAKLLAQSGPSQPSSEMQDRLIHLSGREAQILSILGSGLSNREIGDKLDLSEKTIKHYVTGILQKLKVRNRVEAAILASEHVPQQPTLHS
ncbi:LuxR C-terminal-related transcriptional regulator [Microvirga pudoricolor]|uniref:LuxR C-terminal-related transcriptional regulator n=1 Tax=Microvirga pudoricolor TaxID=2778729 RepID=UPI00194FABE6|nr:response regulator transcription factor [Microvirga pudoricolor]MBM6594263.1 response regulator transcription factor [Microvirga pudoricolor]